MKLIYAPSPKPDLTIYPATIDEWNDWTWQLRHSLKSEKDFSKFFDLTESEKKIFQVVTENKLNSKNEIFNIRSTPYYAALASRKKSLDPIRRILVPHEKELAAEDQGLLDPLGEKKNKNNPVSRIVHRYSDRVLFLVTDICSVYCRYCTRKHFTGADQAFIKKSDYDEAINYLKKMTGIREVILSGGDPLTISDGQLEKVLSDLRNIDHIEIIRIGSRMPVVAPMRITDNLVQIIKKAKPVFLMTHFNHPRELTEEAAQALEKLVDHGIPVMNQMVLLNGVNNHPAIVQALSRRLLYLRVKPYYMFQCDPSIGTEYLRTSIEDSLQIQKELWGHLSGLAMPNLAVDIPNGGGKVYYTPSYEKAATQKSRSYQGWDGVQAEYINPSAAEIIKPDDFENYLAEWEQLKSAKFSSN